MAPPKLLLCSLQALGPNPMTRCPKAHLEAHLPQFQPVISLQALASFDHLLHQFQRILLKRRLRYRNLPPHPKSEPAERHHLSQDRARQAQHKPVQLHLRPLERPQVGPIHLTLFIDGL